MYLYDLEKNNIIKIVFYALVLYFSLAIFSCLFFGLRGDDDSDRKVFVVSYGIYMICIIFLSHWLWMRRRTAGPVEHWKGGKLLTPDRRAKAKLFYCFVCFSFVILSIILPILEYQKVELALTDLIMVFLSMLLGYVLFVDGYYTAISR